VSTATPSGARRERSSRRVQGSARPLLSQAVSRGGLDWKQEPRRFSLLWCDRFGQTVFTMLNPDAPELWMREMLGEHGHFSAYRTRGQELQVETG
jgi:hypothetical protein